MTFSNYNPLERSVSFERKTYDVFLSFRGEDTRKTIVDHLNASLQNASVNVFLDSVSLHKGEEISSTILKAIEQSSICIPIFSRNYAESHWCLEEVNHMLKCSCLVIPLFFYVEPADVRHPEKGVFREALAQKRSRYGDDKVQEWKRALSKAASFSGWSMTDTLGYEAVLVKSVVQDVLVTLQNKTDDCMPYQLSDCPTDESAPGEIPVVIRTEPQNISDYVFTENQQTKSVINMLKIDSEDSRITVAVCGMAGIGKTFLAKAVHKEICSKFDATCFVSDVRNKAQHANGIAKMQREILKDLTKFKGKVNDEVHGRSLMQDHLRYVKAFVVLEYVDDPKHLHALQTELLGPGSRVLVTTLNPEPFEGQGQVDFIYEMPMLDRDQALQHFSWHAFMRNSPPSPAYEELSQACVDICKGLPRLMEVLGAHLYNKTISEWHDTVCILQNTNGHDKYAVLKHCYDGLNIVHKNIFLDMACLFIGRKRESVLSFWEANHYDANAALTHMKVKSLISLNDDGMFTMHSELRDMGRAILAAESMEAGERTRIWKLEDAEQVLLHGKGTDRVRCLTYIQQEVKLQTDNFIGMINLQLLWLDGAVMEGDFTKMPQALKWLRWENCPFKCLPPEWSMKHVAVLNLSFSKQIERVFNPFSPQENGENLKVLKLNDCPSLKVLPDLVNHPFLVRLELSGCTQLTELPDSIGILKELRHLDLTNCYNLTSLPESIASLECLEGLFLSNCCKITRLPDSLGELHALKKIRLDGTGLQKLPNSFRWLSCLGKLNLHGCIKLRSLPQCIGELYLLQTLDLNCCHSLRAIPGSLYECKNLRYLDISECRWINLGEELGELVNLEKLILSSCPYIKSLPASIAKLQKLWHLNASDCISLFQLPEEIGHLINLEELLLNRCYNLYKLPESIGNLSNMKVLEMEENYSLVNLPLSFCKLTSLERLKSGGCSLPEQIQEFSSLEFLCITSFKYAYLPQSVSNLSKLNKLHLHHCTELIELPALPCNLTEVRIEECLGLKRISKMSHMYRLKRLQIQNCRELAELPDFSSLQALQELSISGCGNFRRNAGLEGLKSLRKLQVTNCGFPISASGTSIVRPRQLIKETKCLELFSFSANDIPKSLQHKLDFNGDALLKVVVEVNEPCTGIILCLLARFESGMTSFSVELHAARDGKEIFSTKLINDSINVTGDQIFVHILRKYHPLVAMLHNGDILYATTQNEEERNIIRNGGLQLFEDEDGMENIVLESLGKDLTLLMETYSEDAS